jgi:hypothetical protein
MHPKLEEWFNTKGRRLAELKASGGMEFMILGYNDVLTEEELTEFKFLTVQMDTIIWALSPNGIDAQETYIQEIKEFFSSIEEPYYKIKNITKGRKLPRGYA